MSFCSKLQQHYSKSTLLLSTILVLDVNKNAVTLSKQN